MTTEPLPHPPASARLSVQALALILGFIVTSAFAGEPEIAVRPAEKEPWFSGGIEGAFDSKYVTEGRDNVPSAEGLVSVQARIESHGLVTGLWYGESVNDPYDELNAFFGYERKIADLALAATYTFLHFPCEGTHSHEWLVSAAYERFEWLTPGATFYYDFDKLRGGFLELSLRGKIKLKGDRISLQPYALAGVDWGYVSAANDDWNNFQIGIELPVKLHEKAELVGYVAHSWALTNLRKEGLGDVSWAGIKLVLEF